MSQLDEALDRFRRAAAQTGDIIAAIDQARLDDPTPCTEWSVRDLLAHVITGNLTFEEWARTGEHPSAADPLPADMRPADYAAAYDDGIRRLDAAFTSTAFPTRSYRTPVGEGPAAILVEMRFNELLLHGWDLAHATGQPTDLDESLVAASQSFFDTAAAPRGPGAPFAEPTTPGPTATAADRLAALAGRRVD